MTRNLAEQISLSLGDGHQSTVVTSVPWAQESRPGTTRTGRAANVLGRHCLRMRTRTNAQEHAGAAASLARRRRTCGTHCPAPHTVSLTGPGRRAPTTASRTRTGRGSHSPRGGGAPPVGTHRPGPRPRLWPPADSGRRWPVGSLSGPSSGPPPCRCPGSLRTRRTPCPSGTGSRRPGGGDYKARPFPPASRLHTTAAPTNRSAAPGLPPPDWSPGGRKRPERRVSTSRRRADVSAQRLRAPRPPRTRAWAGETWGEREGEREPAGRGRAAYWDL